MFRKLARPLARAVLGATLLVPRPSNARAAELPLRPREADSRALGPPGGEIRALALGGDGTRLYAGTAQGHLLAAELAGAWSDGDAALGHDAVIGAIAVPPGAPRTAYSAFWSPDGTGGALRSEDGGAHWARLDLPGVPLRALAIARDGTIYAGGPTGIWLSQDEGRSWSALRGPRDVESLYAGSAGQLLAGTRRLAYLTANAGQDWARLERGMNIDRHVFTIVPVEQGGDRLLAGTCGYLYASDDGGARWSERKQGIPFEHRRIQALAVDPSDPTRLWAGTRGGLYVSSDAGLSFENVLGSLSVTALALDPRTAQVFAATEERGVLRGAPGRSFAEHNLGLRLSRVISFDASADGRRLLAARWDGPGASSIFVSSDAGLSWSRAALDVPNVAHVRLLPEPELGLVGDRQGRLWRLGSSGDVRALPSVPGELRALEAAPGLPLLAASSTGLWLLSADPGATASGFQALGSGSIVALDLAGDRYLAATASGRLYSGQLGPEASGVESFAGRGLPAPLVDLAIDPSDRNRVYAITDTTLLLSLDAGRSWQALPLPWRPNRLGGVAVHAGDVIALDARGALYRGSDRGRHWRVYDADPALERAQQLSLVANGVALVSTIGHGIRAVALPPSLAP